MADQNSPNRMPSAQPRAADMTWLLLNPLGRISREIYVLGVGLTLCVSEVLARIWQKSVVFEINADGGLEIIEITNASIISMLALIPVTWMIMALLAKRCHDRGMSGLLCLLWLVPFANFVFLVFMGVMAGEPGPNRYGPRTNARPE